MKEADSKDELVDKLGENVEQYKSLEYSNKLSWSDSIELVKVFRNDADIGYVLEINNQDHGLIRYEFRPVYTKNNQICFLSASISKIIPPSELLDLPILYRDDIKNMRSEMYNLDR